MASVRGTKHNKYKDDGTLTGKRYGRVVLDTEPLGLSEPYGTREFSTADVDEAVASYGQWGQDDHKGFGILVKKIIGAGRFGIVALVHYINEKGETLPCVLKLEKYRHHVHGTLAREEKALTKFKGAKHILQILDVTQLVNSERARSYGLHAAGHVAPNPAPQLCNEGLDRAWSLNDFAHQPIRNFVLVEHAAHGDLNVWLSKASRSGNRWPVRAIWMLFRSLVQGLIGMGYPPKEVFGGANRPEWDPNDPIDEHLPYDYPMSEHYQPQQTTHFDLEPSNVLASSSVENGNMPIFKIADFGSAQFFSEYATNPAYFDKDLFWKCRFSGKGNYFTPEQFTRQWDHLDLQTHLADDNLPNPFVAVDGSKPPVAGNYGMHSNVFQVGVIIWCAITLCAFQPLTAMNYPLPNGQEIVTWGGALQNERFNGVDEELRGLIQRCMAEDPVQRPSLGLLMRIIEDRLGANDLEPEEVVATWAQEFFSSPRNPGDKGRKRRLSNDSDEDDDDDDDGDARRHAPRRRTEAEPMIHGSFQQPRRASELLNRRPRFQHGRLALRPAPVVSQSVGGPNDALAIDPRLFQVPQMPEQRQPIPAFGAQPYVFDFGDQVPQMPQIPQIPQMPQMPQMQEQWQGIPAFGAQPDVFNFGGQQMQQNAGAATFQPGGYFNVHAQYGENPFQPPPQQHHHHQQQQPAQYMPLFNQPFQQMQPQQQPVFQGQQQPQPDAALQGQVKPEDVPWW
ncbi:kinase-like domain-containing protein [Colletotrichum cereale]|nr:kinase-like domain-containing protein [Colletotrichum cereale]